MSTSAPVNIKSSLSARSLALPFAQVMRSLVTSRNELHAIRDCELRGESAAASFLKAAVAAQSTGTHDELIQHPISRDLVAALANYGLFDLIAASAWQFPFNAQVTMLTASGGASSVAEGAVKPVSAMSFSAAPLTPEKVAKIFGVAKEVAHDPSVLDLLIKAVLPAVAGATDAKILATLIAGAGTVAASGTAASNFLTDLRAASALIPTGVGSKLVASASPSQMKRLALLGSTDGELALPGLRVNGGEVQGITFVPSDALTNSIVIVDASQCTANPGGATTAQSEQASLQMDDAPTDPPTASTVFVSAFQHDLVFAKVERTYALAKQRANAACVITGTNYGA